MVIFLVTLDSENPVCNGGNEKVQVIAVKLELHCFAKRKKNLRLQEFERVLLCIMKAECLREREITIWKLHILKCGQRSKENTLAIITKLHKIRGEIFNSSQF